MIWGNDDLGLIIEKYNWNEKDFTELLNLYYDIHDGITKNWAYNHNMIRF